jgi:hypothetical protein
MTISFRKYIHKGYNGKWVLQKHINGTLTHFGVFTNLEEAINYRDRLIENNWNPLPETIEQQEKKQAREYYKGVQRNSKGTSYRIVRKGDNKYLGMTNSIEEALYYRDLYSDCKVPVPRPKEVDLQTDNPYLLDGLRYPLPERLILKENNTNYGKGSIQKRSKGSYRVYYNDVLFTTCRTYEQAYYVRQELQKCDWDKKQVPQILADYPKWYTWLLFFYQYISKQKDPNGEWNGKYKIVLPVEYTDGKLEYLIYSNLEDALFERDYLKEHNWDYESLVYCINDTANPYYNMDLPPYPERKIRRIKELKKFTNELNTIRDYILKGVTNQKECAKLMDTTSMNIRNWLKKYDTDWKNFKELVESGEDIWSVLELKHKYFTPDLSPYKPSNYSGYVHHTQSKRSPYCVSRKGEYYGAYKDKKTAKKVVKELEKVNWDKKELKKIQAKLGHENFLGSKKWVYPNGKGTSYTIRKKDKNRKMISYGTFKDKRVAEFVRDMLIECDWDSNRVEEFRCIGEYYYERINY